MWNEIVTILVVLVLLLAGAVAVVVFAAQKPVNTVRTLVKQVGIWLGIVALLPLAVWYGVNLFSPPPDWRKYSEADSEIDDKIRETQSYDKKPEPKRDAEVAKIRQEKKRLKKELEEAERVYYQDMFWIAYPVGLLAIIVGTLFPVQVVGAGLLFGGLISLGAGCYSYWDKMGDWLRFSSLLLALVVLIGLGTLRFRATNPQNAPG